MYYIVTFPLKIAWVNWPVMCYLQQLLWQIDIFLDNLVLRPGHTALYGLITAKTRQKVVSREADDVVRVDVEFKTSKSRFIDVAGRGEKSERRRTR